MKQKYCKVCKKMVIWQDVPMVTMPNGKIYYLGCSGQNSNHFCEKLGTSQHDDLECDCLDK
jgi:hypothetical protein